MSLRWCLLFLLALSACPGRLDNPDRFTKCQLNVETDIFATKCGAMAGCHSAMSPQGGLDLATPGVGMRILMGKSATCQMKPYTSYIYEKVSQAAPTCGSQMPSTGDLLNSAELKCVQDYLAGLADGGT
jgi:hypothetical protein